MPVRRGIQERPGCPQPVESRFVRDWIGIVFWVALGGTVGAMAAPAPAAPADADVEAAARRVLEPGEYQTSLPSPEPIGPRTPPRRTRRPDRDRTWERDRSGDDSSSPSSSGSSGDTNLGPVAKALFYLLIGVTVIAIALMVGRWLSQPKQANVRVKVATATGPTQGPLPPPPLSEHERLALEERYDEAIHVLLLNALAPLRQSYSDALTSRELLARVGLKPPAEDAMRGLVVAVELSHFGAISASRAEYDAAVERFGVVQTVLARGRAAAA